MLRFQNKILRKVQDKIQINLVVYKGYYKVGMSVLLCNSSIVGLINLRKSLWAEQVN